MANHDGFNSSEMMYPAVTTAGEVPQPLIPAAPFAAPGMGGFGGPVPRGPELIHGAFNQTWLINCLRRRWLMSLMLGALFAALVGAILLWLFPLSSSITAMVHVQEEQGEVIEDRKRFSPQELEIFQETQLSMIKSHFVLQSALGRSSIAQLDAVRKEEPDPISWLQDDLHVTFQGETLAVRYDGEEDSEEMKKVVDAVIEAYRDEVIGKDLIRSQEMRDNLTKLHKDLTKELQDKTEKYHTLAANIGGIDSPIAREQLNMLVNEIRLLQQQITDKKGELVEIEISKNLALVQLTSQAAVDAAVAEEMDKDPMIANYKTEEYTLSQEIRAQSSVTRGGSSAQLKRLKQSLAQLQAEMQNYQAQTEQEIRKALKNAPNEGAQIVMQEYVMRRDSITADINKLTAELDEKYDEINQKGERSGELTMLGAELEQLTDIEQELDHKLRSWEIKDKAADDLFRVLQKATAIEQINTLQRYALAGLGGIAAFCATCYGVALIEFRRRRLNGASDMDEGLGLRVLGVLPAVSSRKAMVPGSMLAAQISESIDNVRATLMHDSTSRKRQVVLITSPATMEGTTTVASHLALSLTRAGRRTLLIDGDIREPSLHKLFGMPLEDGFCEVLRSDIDVADAVRPTNTEGLWLLPAGHCDMDAIHALATDQPQPIFEKLREEFDFIIIDGAPALGLSDSISIGQHVDGAILTVLRDHSEVRKVYQAMELLRSMGVRLLGSVVNGVPLKADRRIAQLHKNQANKPRKIAATKVKEAASSQPAEEVATAVDVADEEEVIDDILLDDAGLKEEIDLDFDDLGLDDEQK